MLKKDNRMLSVFESFKSSFNQLQCPIIMTACCRNEVRSKRGASCPMITFLFEQFFFTVLFNHFPQFLKAQTQHGFYHV